MFQTYEEIRQWRNETMPSVAADHFQLNAFHDQVMNLTVQLAKEKTAKEQGTPPAPFAFFLMGSAGRYEQSVWSDQDHGILFEGADQKYFLHLGEEISRGLEITGYELCEGRVMASNPLWCQSVDSFKQQITDWLEEASWQSLRNFSILLDSRVLNGKEELLLEIKRYAFSRLEEEPRLYSRLVENFEFIKKGIGVFGQLLPDQRQGVRGEIHLKETAYFPYVNALRLLAMRKGVSAASTLKRFISLADTLPFLKDYEQDFLQLLEFRLRFRNNADNYGKVHLLSIEQLSRNEKQELKYLIKRGNQLFDKVRWLLKEEGAL
ncbi:DUF294 nucleotidyltransferase-like domain-containing protein [Halobacillus andaensis]|uniref:DUF294 nucleotidyltransferase-like domain-containing protein n=1 Tax=Halobacillus andaensis TaxID=1176239 RepID=UPI003D70B9F0